MSNTEDINPLSVVRDEQAAAALSAPSPPLPSGEVIRNLASFLPKDVDDYVKVREDAQYYVDIGQCKAVDQIYRPLHDRVRTIKDKYNASIRVLLTQLMADQITETNAAVYATPSKTRARMRPVPKSSSVNKVIISRSKRNSGDRTTVSNSNGSTRGKTLFSGTSSKGQTTDDSISPDAIAEEIEGLQDALDLMTELTIDPNTTVLSTTKSTAPKKNKKAAASLTKKPFIATEESVMNTQGTIIMESSTASNQTGAVMKTRSRTRQANNTIVPSSATKSQRGAGSTVTASASKSNRTRKVTSQVVTASPKSVPMSAGGLAMRKNLSQSASNLNVTQSKRNLVDLSSSGLKKAGSLSRLAAATSATSSTRGSSHNLTPKRMPRRACAESPALPSTPSSFMVAARRQQLESARNEKLIMSEDKRKKAEENKKALLEMRINAMKSEREKRMEKIAENRKVIDHEKEIKLRGIVDVGHSMVPVLPVPTAAMTKAEARNAERRVKLAQLQLEQEIKKANEAKLAAAAAIAAQRSSGLKAKSAKSAATTKATKAVTKNKSKPKGCSKKLPKQVEVEHEPMDVEHYPNQHFPAQQDDVSVSIMSPIAKASGINGKIDETFTAPLEPLNLAVAIKPKDDVSVAVANSTFISVPEPSAQPIGGNDGTFVMPTAPPPITPGKGTAATATASTTTTVTFNLANSLKSKLNKSANYEMTPPPRERTYDNYDISVYVDSDDEEKQAAQEAAQDGKRIPEWAKGKQFIKRVHEQFSMPADQLAAWTQRIFPKPVLPVPLDDMGMHVRERYAQRSSSVNWKTAIEIESKLKMSKDKNQKK